jgi:hypothetical protein
MSWLIVWAALSVGVVLGFTLSALFRGHCPDAPSATVTTLSPAQAARMGDALYHAGEMLQSGDFEYVSGGFIVQDLGHGVVNFKGDLSLRAVEYE